MKKGKGTVQTIADYTGLSTATVSRVMNNHANVSPSTRATVINAMKLMGLGEPNPMLVGLIVPDSSNAYFSQMCFRFEHVLDDMGAHLLISSSEERPDRELRLVERFRFLGVKGLIYIPSSRSMDSLLNLIADGRMPVVVFDRKVTAGRHDYVAVNSRSGTQRAVDYLVAHGHSRIAYLKGLAGTETARDRFESFVDALARNRLEIAPEWVFEGDYTLGAGRASAERLIAMRHEDRPTGILVANDMMAIGLMQRLQQDGWTLPAELSVIGFDNVQWSQWTYPSLTTIEQPINLLVAESVRLLMKRINEFASNGSVVGEPEVVELDPVLIPRESVAEPFGAERTIELVGAYRSPFAYNE